MLGRLTTAYRYIEFHDDELAAACAGIVDADLYRMQGMVLPPGQNLASHPHPEHDVVIYMPMDHPVDLLFQYPDEACPTEAGKAVLIPAGRWHSLPVNQSVRRFTIGLLYWNRR